MKDAGAGLMGLALRLTTYWALLGGVVLIGVIGVNMANIIGVALHIGSFPGDFELTELGVAIAAFSFLPYCQAHGLNVTADIFTARASPRWLAVFNFLASLVAMLFAGLLLSRMYYGMLDQREYDYTTAILQISIWKAFVPCLISLALLVFASFATLIDAGDRVRRS